MSGNLRAVAGTEQTLPAGAEQTAPADRAGVAGTDVAAELAVIAATRYQPLGELARGGGGRIVRARDVAFDRIVALKEPLDPAHGDRLRVEAAILASLSHPSIVPIHDQGVRADGVPFFAMKLVEGRSLRDVIREASTLELRLALIPQVVAVAEAVAYAHARGVIHRDLKPTNVLVGAFGETVVIDWGIAKVLGDEPSLDDAGAPRPGPIEVSQTVTGAVMGTPAYMAPEQARGERVDARADVYALGAILYHLLAGAAPYAERADVIAAVLEGPPPPIADRQPRVPSDLAAIVTKAMARAPADRYPSAAGFAEDLVRFQTGQLVRARRYSLGARARRLLRRRAGWLAAGGLAVASAVIAAVLVPGRAPAPGAECGRAGDDVRARWTPARRQQVIDAFRATGADGAAAAAERVVARVDDAAAAQVTARVEACRDTRARGRQSEARLDLRMACLDQQLAHLGATIDLLATADARRVEDAPAAVGRLDDPAACAEPTRFALAPPEPADPATRRRLAALRERLGATQLALTWRRHEEVAGELRALTAEADAIGYCPVTVEARRQLGVALAYSRRDDVADHDAAIATLRRAAREADACGDDWNRVKALTVMIDVWKESDLAGLASVAAEGEAAGQRIIDPDARARLYAVLAAAAYHAGDLPRAAALYDQALAIIGARPSTALPLVTSNRSVIARETGDLDLALELAERGVAALRRDHGVDHPVVAKAEARILAVTHVERGEPELAAAVLARALRAQARLGPEHKDVIASRVILAGTLVDRGRFAEAAAQLAADRPLAERVVGVEHDTAVMLDEQLARAYAGLGRLDEAIALAREGVAIRTRTVGADHPKTAHARARLGALLADRGERDAAIRELSAAHQVLHARLGPRSPDTLVAARELERVRRQ